MNINNLIKVNGGGCTACSSCLQRCPKHCITMQADNEGFLYPIVDEETCIDCGLCVKVCHEQHPYEATKPQQVYAAINKDEPTRLASSSGGIFYLLAEKTISEGGVVFGAKYDDNWQVYITYAETLEDVKPFMGSKYVQARTEDSYKDAERFLKEGRRVLYSGTPCQIAGLRHYLRKEYDNLTTVDFVCHGVPSPKVWGIYLKEVVDAVKHINDIQFRNKRNGWKRFNFRLSYNEHDKSVSLTSFHGENHFMRAFLSDMILRPSCYNCQAKSGRSHSDITIADYWGVADEHPSMDDDKGTGLVMVNTEKGKSALDWTKVSYKESTYEQALRHNPAIVHSAKPHPKRAEFFAKLDSVDCITDFITLILRPSLKQRIRRQLRRCKRLIKKLLGRSIGGGKTERVTHTQPTLLPSTIDLTNSHIVSLTFRDKRKGWKEYEMRINLTR